MADLPTGTVTFLFTDIEGSTALWEHHPEAMQIALARHDKILEAAIDGHGGVIVSRMGDGMAAAFASAREAVAAAVAIQQGLVEETWPELLGRVSARVGVHTGEGILIEGQYLNQPLNRCARLMAIGHGGQVLVSGTSEPLVRGALPEGVELVDLGDRRLRDLSEPIRVFQVEHPDLMTAFPPLRSLDSFPGNLPLQVSSFIGRERDLARATEALAERRVVTLTGVGGVGKTRLALQVAAELLPRFREGAWLVELQAVRDPEGVEGAFAAVFGVSPRAGQSLKEAVVEFLHTKQLLLVLDNCEHLLEAVAAFVGMLERTCPGLVVLATSREGLALDGERVVPVPSLAAPSPEAGLDALAQSEAVQLFVERGRDADPDFALTAHNAVAVAQVCRRLDGVPLAIELAAARIRAMNPDELARGLERRFETLAGGRRGAVQRHQTLRAAIDWSYDLLSEAERRLLARLAVFAGGCTRAAAQAVCSGEPIAAREVFDLIVSLVDRSLVIAERDHPETRYRLLETIREYAEERLAEAGETASLRDRHAEFYVEYVRSLSEEMQGPQQIEAGNRVRSEAENLLLAINHSIDADDADLAMRFVHNTPGPGTETGYTFLLPIDSVLGLSGAADHALYPAALGLSAAWAAMRGDLATAQMRSEQALAAAQHLGSDPDQRVAYLLAMTNVAVAYALGDHVAAAQYSEQAAEIVQSTGLLGSAALALGGAATFRAMAGDQPTAVRLATEGLSRARQVGMPLAIAMNLNALAAALAEDDPERAKGLLREGSQLRMTFGYEAQNDVTQAVFVTARVGDWPQLLELAPISIRHLHWTHARPQLAGVLNVVARALVSTAVEVAAVLQGAASRLARLAMGIPGPSSASITTDAATTPIGGGERSDSGLIVELRRTTTDLLIETLGKTRLRDLRAQGEAMDDDSVVAFAIDAIAKAQAAMPQ